jgi:hypothetical protein
MSDTNHARQSKHLPEVWYERPFISHEWEELVEKLSTSQDPKLREIGILEQEFLKLRKPPLKAA